MRNQIREWTPGKRWNPFNSHKLLAHVERWRHIQRGKQIPAPILVTVDPVNACDLDCLWCNAQLVRQKRRGRMISGKALIRIADFLPSWEVNTPYGKAGVKAVCIAGGGEPLLNPAIGNFINRLSRQNIEIGVVTNGTQMHKYLAALSKATWVGVSVDAARRETFNRLKRIPANSEKFDQIIENIGLLAKYAKKHKGRLGLKHSAYGISFKYLLHKDNIAEVYQAARLAKKIGCKNIHFRPAGTSWDKLGTKDVMRFSAKDIALYNAQIAKALALDDKDFSVYGVTHKFSSQFGIANYFSKCHAIFMTAVIMPSSDSVSDPDAFTVGLCCDRRGDAKLELCKNISNPKDILKMWGSRYHWKLHDSLKIKKECPRCTYQPHNEIYEQVIMNDSMTHRFI